MLVPKGGHFVPFCMTLDTSRTTEGPSWGHSKVVLGAIGSFLEPFYGHLSPKIDKVSEELTLKYPHEEPCVVMHFSPRVSPIMLKAMQGLGYSRIRERTALGSYSRARHTSILETPSCAGTGVRRWTTARWPTGVVCLALL